LTLYVQRTGDGISGDHAPGGRLRPAVGVAQSGEAAPATTRSPRARKTSSRGI